MKLSVWLVGSGLLVLLGLSLSGCLPSRQSAAEEENEPHFLAGKSCVSRMDYKGAVEEFEKALEVNPHSAQAHFELALLDEGKEADPAAAIYHYDQFLKLHPSYPNAENIRQRINTCKQDLAKTVLPLPVTPALQRDFEKLAEDNKRLSGEVEKWRAYAAWLQTLTNPPAQPPSSTTVAQAFAQSPPKPGGSAPPRVIAENRPPANPAAPRTYTVKADDTPIKIARMHGVKLEAFLAANPGLEPRRLRPGQTVNIPAP